MFYVYCIVVAIFVAWLLLVVSGWLSIRWSRRTPERRPALRLILAMMPVLVGLILFQAHLRWSMNDTTMNLSWPFIVPIGIGIIAIVFWFRARCGRVDIAH